MLPRVVRAAVRHPVPRVRAGLARGLHAVGDQREELAPDGE